MSIESRPYQEEPETKRSSGWKGFFQRLGIGGPPVSTTDFEAIDPLGGILHPNYENRMRQEAAEAKRFFLRRWFKQFVDWVRLDEPNLTTGDTRLDVDPGEVGALTPQQAEDKRAAVAAFKGVGPVETDFYDDLLSPKAPSDAPQTHQK
jgi:hypothetical protein